MTPSLTPIHALSLTSFSPTLKNPAWVNSSAGNFTTRIYEEFKFKNEIKVSNNGQDKEVEQKIKVQTEIRIENDIGHEISESIISREYPVKIKISTLPGAEADTF
ncbi:hypothetical protein MKX03_027728, partial [Papaver bracteatum]